MSTATPSNQRASLLSGLRTGGVRSASGPMGNVPHTAAPGGLFNITPRFASEHHGQSIFPEEQDIIQDIQNNSFGVNRAIPMTAAVDGPNNRFMQQQQPQMQQQQLQRGMNPNSVPFSPAYPAHAAMGQQPQQQQQQQPVSNQQAAIQMQMMQLEILRIQAIQAQQYQAELIAQAQRQQAQQAQQAMNRRASANFNPPATAGPLNGTFDLRSAALSAQMRRSSIQPGLSAESDNNSVPMTAALNGRFGTRSVSGLSSNRFSVDEYDDNPSIVPSTPNGTTVISGGTSLGKPSSNNINSVNSTPITKSDSASSWRRGGNNNSVLSGLNRTSASPSVKITPPPFERKASVSPPPGLSAPSPTTTKSRPIPLRFNLAASQPMLPAVAIETGGDNNNDDTNSSSDISNSPPMTPRSSSSNEGSVPLSPREEAAKKLYEGLGMGRPAPPVVSIINNNRMATPASQPTRQPRGPPSGADELGPKNFATRIRRKAIGGLGVLMGARERRDFVQAF